MIPVIFSSPMQNVSNRRRMIVCIPEDVDIAAGPDRIETGKGPAGLSEGLERQLTSRSAVIFSNQPAGIRPFSTMMSIFLLVFSTNC